MTLQQLQDKYEVDSIPELIYDSYINGQHKQTLGYLHEVAELSDYDVDDVLNDLAGHFPYDPRRALRSSSPLHHRRRGTEMNFKNKYFNLTLKETM